MNLRELYEHLDEDARRILHAAAEKAAREGRSSISIELFLLCLLRDREVGATTMAVLDRAGADGARIEAVLADKVVAEPRSPSGVLPSFDESLARLMREAVSLAADYAETAVSPVRFFETIARHGNAWPQLTAMLPGFDIVDVDKLAAVRPAVQDATPSEAAGVAEKQDPNYPELSRYGRDMIAAVHEGAFDPVVGFHQQMQAVSAILLRRRQNSAIVVGEAGVGKTACALGYVNAVANRLDSVPVALHDTPLWSLDISALRAGAVVRGALEERLQAIVKDIEGSGMILYVDDIHLLFDQGQGVDALRGVLSGGAVRILGTCGWREWRRHIERDPGLARRVAPVRIQEPDHDEALRIVEGIAPPLAEHHQVRFEENVLDAAVALSRRYIVGRHLPDKAIVALDSACARAHMRGSLGSVAVDEQPAPTGDEETSPADAAPPTIAVTEDDVAAVVSDLTGVPIGTMLSDASKVASTLESTLGERVVGQDDALARCAMQARSYLAGLSDRRRPVGALIFCGPSGVGKTETAHALADVLFGGRMLSINMSEYQEAHTVSGLKGAPAGYVGYGEGGVLTEGIRRTPYCVVLLDEIEKAHPGHHQDALPSARPRLDGRRRRH